MKLVCISDTHMLLHQVHVPDGDILIHSGDHTNSGSKAQLEQAIIELGALKPRFKHILTCWGNHDRFAERQLDYMKQFAFEQGVTVLHDESITIDGVKFYGSSWTSIFGSWAFMLNAPERKQKWDMIPDDTDVLITHGPAYGFGDELDQYGSEPGKNVGCVELLIALEKIKPKLFVHGHIHCQYGIHQYGSIKIINASSCTEQYRASNLPITVEI